MGPGKRPYKSRKKKEKTLPIFVLSDLELDNQYDGYNKGIT